MVTSVTLPSRARCNLVGIVTENDLVRQLAELTLAELV
ncbi:MAG: hypothetical protein RLZZ450_1966 [Pseudomonadota bacterium]|jgi:hypothetical protein